MITLSEITPEHWELLAEACDWALIGGTVLIVLLVLMLRDRGGDND